MFGCCSYILLVNIGVEFVTQQEGVKAFGRGCKVFNALFVTSEHDVWKMANLLLRYGLIKISMITTITTTIIMVTIIVTPRIKKW